MSRPRIHLRQALLGLSFVGTLGFGATQALGSPQQAQMRNGTCPAKGYDYPYDYCRSWCRNKGLTGGYCNAIGYCNCGDFQ